MEKTGFKSLRHPHRTYPAFGSCPVLLVKIPRLDSASTPEHPAMTTPVLFSSSSDKPPPTKPQPDPAPEIDPGIQPLDPSK